MWYPTLLKEIPESENVSFKDYMRNDIQSSLFLEAVNKEEVIKEVKNFKSKRSCGYDEINMPTVKMVVNEIVLPFT